MQNDVLVFIGRFQPLHLGHEMIIDEAMRKCKRLIVLIGSANRSRSIQNPWTFEERFHIFKKKWGWEIEDGRLVVLPLNDYLYNDPAWIATVQRIVGKYGVAPNVSLVGYAKDNTSYYLNLFPQWGAYDIKSQHALFNSTEIRQGYFRNLPVLPNMAVSEIVYKDLQQFMYTDYFKDLVLEANDNRAYQKQWEHVPFPPTFNTVDNVVIQSGHILLVDRKDAPGKGLKALPGGFIKVSETLVDSAMRELKEETWISDGPKPDRNGIPNGVLQSFITKQQTFDDPRRSTRGRTITQAFLYELPNKAKLYRVSGKDDAAKADWYPLGTIPANQFFEDHYFIMCKMLGLTME